MLLSNAAKSNVTSSRKLRHFSSRFCFSASAAVVVPSSASSGGGVGGRVALVTTRDAGSSRRLDIRLNGFSSTFRRRDL